MTNDQRIELLSQIVGYLWAHWKPADNFDAYAAADIVEQLDEKIFRPWIATLLIGDEAKCQKTK